MKVGRQPEKRVSNGGLSKAFGSGDGITSYQVEIKAVNTVVIAVILNGSHFYPEVTFYMPCL